MAGADSKKKLAAEVKEFLNTRRAGITPEQAGLPAYGGNRRVAGLRREEVALLAGVSVDYYTRLVCQGADRQGRSRRACGPTPCTKSAASRICRSSAAHT